MHNEVGNWQKAANIHVVKIFKIYDNIEESNKIYLLMELAEYGII